MAPRVGTIYRARGAQSAPRCPECGRFCRARECDDGIGPYEFWGQRGNDRRPYLGSSCCEAQLEFAWYEEPYWEECDD